MLYRVSTKYLQHHKIIKKIQETNMQQLKRAEVTVYGEVQRVGYRYIVQDTARRFNVKGYVQNMPDGTVKISAEAPKETIKKFIKALRVKEPPIKVESIQTKYSKPTGEFKYFKIKYGKLAEEMAEGFSTGLKYMNLSKAETKQGFQKLGAETKEGFQTLQTEMKDGFQTVVGEIKGMREDMNRNFQEMSAKYSTISKILGEAVKTIQEESTKTRKELIRAVDNLSRLVEEFVRSKRKKHYFHLYYVLSVKHNF